MEEQNPDLQPCQYCGEETEDLAPCPDCGLLLCPACLESHDCDEDD